MSCHSVAVVLIQLQTKQIRINIHRRNNIKTQYKQYKPKYMQTHTLQNPHIPTHTHTHITKPT